jgi:hypothetical protein
MTRVLRKGVTHFDPPLNLSADEPPRRNRRIRSSLRRGIRLARSGPVRRSPCPACTCARARPSNPLIHYRLGLLYQRHRPTRRGTRCAGYFAQPATGQRVCPQQSWLGLAAAWSRVGSRESVPARARSQSGPRTPIYKSWPPPGTARQGTRGDRAVWTGNRAAWTQPCSVIISPAHELFHLVATGHPKRWLPSTRTQAHAGPRFVQIATAHSPAPGRALCR